MNIHQAKQLKKNILSILRDHNTPLSTTLLLELAEAVDLNIDDDVIWDAYMQPGGQS